jgi:hypothetical protein
LGTDKPTAYHKIGHDPQAIEPKSGTKRVALSGRIGGLGRYGNRSERVDRSPCG